MRIEQYISTLATTVLEGDGDGFQVSQVTLNGTGVALTGGGQFGQTQPRSRSARSNQG